MPYPHKNTIYGIAACVAIPYIVVRAQNIKIGILFGILFGINRIFHIIIFLVFWQLKMVDLKCRFDVKYSKCSCNSVGESANLLSWMPDVRIVSRAPKTAVSEAKEAAVCCLFVVIFFRYIVKCIDCNFLCIGDKMAVNLERRRRVGVSHISGYCLYRHVLG